jgi:predicted methyltransferase
MHRIVEDLLLLAKAKRHLTVVRMRTKALAYAGPTRDGWQRPEDVIDALPLHQGASVTDIGAGGGYFTFRLANAVGEQGQRSVARSDDTCAASPGITAVRVRSHGAQPVFGPAHRVSPGRS